SAPGTPSCSRRHRPPCCWPWRSTWRPDGTARPPPLPPDRKVDASPYSRVTASAGSVTCSGPQHTVHVEDHAADAGLAQQVVHLTAMMGLMIEEMGQQQL